MNRQTLIEDIKDFDKKLGYNNSNFRDFNCSDETLQIVHDIIQKPINLTYDEIIKLSDFAIYEYMRKFIFMNDYKNVLKLADYLNYITGKLRCYLETNDLNSILNLLEKSEHASCYHALGIYYYRKKDKINAKKYYQHLLQFHDLREQIPSDIISQLKNEDSETEYEKFVKFRKLEDKLETVISNKYLRRIVLNYHVF